MMKPLLILAALNATRTRRTCAALVALMLGFGTAAQAVGWSPVGALATARHSHTATLLPSGKVLVAGGTNGPYPGDTSGSHFASAELYDPATNAWSAAGNLATARAYHTETLLPSGKVLVTGGFSDVSPYRLPSAELYDPTTNSWSAAGSFATGRAFHTATLLATGKVLIAGGIDQSTNNTLRSAQLYDPATNAWSTAGNLTIGGGRKSHTATLLPGGKVLVTAGHSNTLGYLKSAELYDPATNAWSATGSLAAARTDHTATLLPSGKVLAVGGIAGVFFALSSVEIYDPATNVWSAASSLTSGRYTHQAVLLTSGKVLIIAGLGDSGIRGSTQLYDPTTNAWSAAGNLATPRTSHTATLLPSGQVLVAAGDSQNSPPALASAELYTPPDSPPDGDGDGLLDVWEVTWWGTNAGHSALDDFDRDGIPELLEEAFGLNPKQPDAVQPAVNEGGYLTITLTKHPGVTYEVQTAATPEALAFFPTTATVLVNNATTLKVRDNFLIGTPPARYLRVKVTAAP